MKEPHRNGAANHSDRCQTGMALMTASRVKTRENVYRSLTSPVAALARRASAVFPNEAPNLRRTRQIFDWPLSTRGERDLIVPKALRIFPQPGALDGTGIASQTIRHEALFQPQGVNS